MSTGLQLTVDSARFTSALRRFTSYSKKDAGDVLIDQARNFCRRVIALCPPSQGKANSEAKARGETAIAADLSRIFSVGSDDFIQRFVDFNQGREAKEDFAHKGAAALGFIYTRALERGEMAGWHAGRRSRNGRVGHIGGAGEGLNRERAAAITTGLRTRDLKLLDIGLVTKSDYEWFKKQVQRNVGFLASGWNKAASRLGYNPPAWIRRHGDGAGSIAIELGDGLMRIVVRNEVRYAGNVKDLTRRVQTALDEQARAMEKKVAHFLERSGKRAGIR